MKLIEDGMRDVVSICLDSPNLTEGDIYKVISMKRTPSHVIQKIAHHPNTKDSTSSKVVVQVPDTMGTYSE